MPDHMQIPAAAIKVIALILMYSTAGTGGARHTALCQQRNSYFPEGEQTLPVSEKAGFRPGPFDVVINEIMSRPSPPAGLPEAVYIELLNRTGAPVNVSGWAIGVGNRYRYLQEHIIAPGGFLIITHSDHKAGFEEFGDVAGVPALPLPDPGGDTIVLRDAGGNVMSAVSFGADWYGSELKASGGWSLEQIDAANPCGGKGNWSASVNSTGGTPGSANSVKAHNPDLTPPELEMARLLPCGTVRLRFSEPMHPQSLEPSAAYHMEKHGSPLNAFPAGPMFDKADLIFATEFSHDKEYIIRVDKRMHDCAGNQISSNAAETVLIIPSVPGHGQIVINEILFDPLPGGATFVELLNISRRTFDLTNLTLASSARGQPGRTRISGTGIRFFFPGEYVVMTVDPETILSHYYTPDPSVFVKMENMPKLYTREGSISLIIDSVNIIDEITYSADMHSPLLTNTKGVSLERISWQQPSSERSNWLSASESAGFATPGMKNSQSAPERPAEESPLSVNPPVFSPDNSGHNDVVYISYTLDKPGYIGSITIFDPRGRQVRRVVRNELFGTSGSYTWDGRDGSNMYSGLGIYLILMELFHPEGDVRQHRETVVLGGRLR